MAAIRTLAVSLIGGLLGVFCLSAGAAQTVYRCGAQGNEYSQLPCQSGRAIDVADPRSPEQVGEARKASAAQYKLALQMANERRANERATRQVVAAGIDYPAAASAQAKIKRGKSEKPDKSKTKSHSRKADSHAKAREFVAMGPGTATKSAKKKRTSAQD